MTMKKKYDMNCTFSYGSSNGYVISSYANHRQPYNIYAYLGLAGLIAPVAGLSIGTLAGLWLAFLGLEYGSPMLLDSVEIILYIIFGAVYALHIAGITGGIVGIIRKAAYAKRCLIFSIIGCLYYSLILGFLLLIRV